MERKLPGLALRPTWQDRDGLRILLSRVSCPVAHHAGSDRPNLLGRGLASVFAKCPR